MAMLAAVSRIAAEHSITCYVSTEERMACGLGVCMGCSVPMKAGGYKRACKEGPVFDSREIEWGEQVMLNSSESERSEFGVVRIRKPKCQSKSKTKPDLSVDFAGIKLKNPVLTASGTFGYGEEFAEFVDLNKLGGVIVKGVSLKPIKGNPPPRIWETPSGMLNAIGLENPGVDVFINQKLPYLRQFDTAVIVNVFGYSLEEYVGVVERLDNVSGVSGH